MPWNPDEVGPGPAVPPGPETKPGGGTAVTQHMFTCSICGEGSREICVACTKDCCENHRCLRCLRCSDCCNCDIVRS